jgi:hypothetical protein
VFTLLPLVAAVLIFGESAPAIATGRAVATPSHGAATKGAKHSSAGVAKARLRSKRKQRARAVAARSSSRQGTAAAELPRLPAIVAAAPRLAATGCPEGMVAIGDAFCIDAYEASLVQVLSDGQERTWPYYEVLPSDVVVRSVSLGGVFPQGYVSGLQASDACQRSGKRLCRPEEWRTACMGPNATVFPYGNAREPGRCNDNGRSGMEFFNPALDGKPEHRWMWGHDGNMIDPRLNQLEGTLARTGQRSGCTNDYGVYDMVGNLHEWVDDPDGTFQGGYYLDTHINGDGCLYRTTAHPMSHLDYSTGFRCCADGR